MTRREAIAHPQTKKQPELPPWVTSALAFTAFATAVTALAVWWLDSNSGPDDQQPAVIPPAASPARTADIPTLPPRSTSTEFFTLTPPPTLTPTPTETPTRFPTATHTPDTSFYPETLGIAFPASLESKASISGFDFTLRFSDGVTFKLRDKNQNGSLDPQENLHLVFPPHYLSNVGSLLIGRALWSQGAEPLSQIPYAYGFGSGENAQKIIDSANEMLAAGPVHLVFHGRNNAKLDMDISALELNFVSQSEFNQVKAALSGSATPFLEPPESVYARQRAPGHDLLVFREDGKMVIYTSNGGPSGGAHPKDGIVRWIPLEQERPDRPSYLVLQDLSKMVGFVELGFVYSAPDGVPGGVFYFNNSQIIELMGGKNGLYPFKNVASEYFQP